jgi:hypothetical protein
MKFISKLLVFSTLSASLWFISGCRQPNFINLTSNNVSQNPSGIYTLQTELEIQDRGIKAETVEVFAVVGGEKLVMVQDEFNAQLWSCDYKLPAGFDEATYYYEAKYSSILDNGDTADRSVTSDLQVFRLENRYVGNLASYRGPVGSEIAVQGRGLTKYDKIVLGELDTTTRYLSENELRFIVPSLPAGLDYTAKLVGGAQGAFEIGQFRIDESKIGVVPSSLEIQSGDSATLLFKIDYEAPSGGLPIDVRTNIPDSVIMPEAVISEGDKTVNIPIKGGNAGEGKLLISAPGFEETEVDILVF